MSTSAIAQEQGGIESHELDVVDIASSTATRSWRDEDEARPNDQLPPIDGGRQAYTFLASSVMMETLIWGMGNAFGTFQEYHERSTQSPLHGASGPLITATGTLIVAGQFFSPFIFYRFFTYYPHYIKPTTLICLLTSAIALLLASIKPTATSIAALQGFVSGWAGGAFYTPCMIWLPQWFVKKQALATGIMFVGSGIGGVVWPFYFRSLLTAIGFEWTLRITAFTQLIFGGLAWYFQRPRLPLLAADAPRRSLYNAVVPRHAKILHKPLGLAHGGVFFFQGAAYWSISFFLSTIASSMGASLLLSTAVLSCLNAASGISLVAVGQLCDHSRFIHLALVLSLVGSLLIGLLLGFCQSLGLLFAFALLFGLANGGFPTFLSPAAKEMAAMGNAQHSSIFIEYLAWRGAACVAGPLIAALLYHTPSSASMSLTSSWGDYGFNGIGPLVIFCTSLMLVSTCTAAVSMLLSKPNHSV